MTASIRTISYRVSFEGRHNEVKAKCWIVLYDRYLAGKTRGLTVRELASQAGVSYLSVKAMITRWYNWKFVLRDRTYPYSWRSAHRSRRWIDKHRYEMPFDRYIQEIEQANESNRVS